MICKPIKTGCTIYCVNFSKSCYLYTWEWYTGSTEGDAPQGQPTDCDTLEEDNAQHTGYVLPLCLRLIRAAFDGTFCTVYTDKAFTTIRLARALAKRGIGLIGMVRGATRPKSMPRGAGLHAAAQPAQPAAGGPRPCPSHSRSSGCPPAVKYSLRVQAGGREAQERSLHRQLARRPGWRLVQPAATRKSTRAGRSTSRQGLEGTGRRQCMGLTSKPAM